MGHRRVRIVRGPLTGNGRLRSDRHIENRFEKPHFESSCLEEAFVSHVAHTRQSPDQDVPPWAGPGRIIAVAKTDTSHVLLFQGFEDEPSFLRNLLRASGARVSPNATAGDRLQAGTMVSKPVRRCRWPHSLQALFAGRAGVQSHRFLDLGRPSGVTTRVRSMMPVRFRSSPQTHASNREMRGKQTQEKS